MKKNPSTVGSYEAETHFSELLERVAGGEEITITRHGLPVAKMIPANRVSSIDSRRESILKIRELASRNRLNGLSIKDLIAEGRR